MPREDFHLDDESTDFTPTEDTSSDEMEDPISPVHTLRPCPKYAVSPTYEKYTFPSFSKWTTFDDLYDTLAPQNT